MLFSTTQTLDADIIAAATEGGIITSVQGARAPAANGSPSKAVTAIQEAENIDPKNRAYKDLLRRYKEETRSLSH